MIEALSRITDGDRTAVAGDQENDCLAAVAPHLSLLRHSLAGGSRHDRHRYLDDRAGRGHLPHSRRRPAPAAGRLTLPQWVSRTKNVC
ncbi:hypothetical protein AB0N92_17000 [Streptomyces sp. NPDC093248]|uniref:hypothetical protein n=1 Tax=Streptomyces sp. NPDC093248 TaxID=3155072 RepID=UPI00342E7216